MGTTYKVGPIPKGKETLPGAPNYSPLYDPTLSDAQRSRWASDQTESLMAAHPEYSYADAMGIVAGISTQQTTQGSDNGQFLGDFRVGSGSPLTPTGSYQQQQYQTIADLLGTRDAGNQAVIDRLAGDNSSYRDFLSQATPQIWQNYGNQYAADRQYVQQSQDLTNLLGQYAGQSNDAQWGNTGNYVSKLSGYNASNNNAVAGLGGLWSSLATPLQSGVSWAGDLTSQAAIADPGALSAQNNALGFLGGAMNGSLDYQSQAAQAYADPAAIAAQWQALGQIQGAANGSLDVTSQAAQAYADPRYTQMLEKGINDLYGVSQGANDVRPGDLDPAAYQASLDAMAKYKELSDPRVTAQEQFMFEQARLKQQQDEMGIRAAVESNLRQRGMLGSGMEIASSALQGQQTSQNRLLSDLGALANADARSMAALGGWSQAAQGLNSQANALATANQQRKLQALGLYTDATGQLRSASFDEAYKRGAAADTVAMSNMDRQLQAMGMSFDAAGNIRQQSFNEEYSRGMAADQASANNQQTRLQGGIAYGNQANTMQQQAFNRGLAADNMAQYNRSTSLDVAEFNAKFNQDERNSQWDRGMDMTNTIMTGNQLNAQNDTNAFGAIDKSISDSYLRNRDVLGMQDNTNTRAHDASRYETDTRNGTINWQSQQIADALSRDVAIGSMQTNQNNAVAQGGVGLARSKIADMYGNLAIDESGRQANSGFFG